MLITYVLLSIIVILLIAIHPIYLRKNNFWATRRIYLDDLVEFLQQLSDANVRGELIIFGKLNKKFSIKKMQNEIIWWVEINAKNDVLHKIRFHLNYNVAYTDFLKTDYFKNYKVEDHNSIFLGNELKTINLIIKRLVEQFFEIDKDETFYIKYKNMRPAYSIRDIVE